MSESLGQVIRARRRAMELTQEQFAELIGKGVRQSDVSRLEHSITSQPRRDRLQRIAEILDVPVGELLLKTSWAETIPEGSASVAPDLNASVPQPVERPSLDDALERARITAERTQRMLNSIRGTGQLSSGTSD